MKVVIDIREGLKNFKAGKGYYVAKVWQYLKRERSLDFLLLLEKGQKLSGDFKSISFPSFLFSWHLWAFWFLRKTKFDLYFSPTSYIVPAFLPPQKSVIVVHDLAVYQSGIRHNFRALIFEKLFLKKAVLKARKVICISGFTKKELVSRFGLARKMIVAPLGPSLDATGRVDSNSIIQKYSLPKNFILFVGTLAPRKNILLALKAFFKLPADLRKKVSFVVVGRMGWGGRKFNRELKKLLNLSGVFYFGYVDEQTLKTFYANAKLFFFPSLYEGFGFPVLDAMSFGVPVVTSKNSSLEEIGGDAVYYTDPYSVGKMAKDLERVLRDESLLLKMRKRGLKRAKKFSWSNHIKTLLKAFGKKNDLL